MSIALNLEVDLKRRGVHTEISSSFSDIDEHVVTIHKAVLNHERRHSPLRGLAKQLEKPTDDIFHTTRIQYPAY